MPLLMCPNDNAAMQTMERGGVQFDMCPSCRGVWLDRGELEKLLDLPIVGDVRGDGYFYGIELVKDKATKTTFDADESERLLRGFLSKALFDGGLYCRADDRGDPVIQLAPPLGCDQTQFDEIEQVLRSVLTTAWTKL